MMLLSLLLHIENHKEGENVCVCVLLIIMITDDAIASRYWDVAGDSKCRDHGELTRIAEQTSGKRKEREEDA